MLPPTGATQTTTRAPARERWSWAVYEFAHTIFSMNVATLYFTVWLVADLGASSTSVALVGGLTAVAVALSVPLFGALSDATQRRMPWIIGFTLVSALATFGIGALGYALPPGASLFGVLAIYAVANYAYQGALPFYQKAP